jgi:iron complex outermembrane receptor protein
VHKGVEFTVSGKATERLTLLGGLTWLDAEITKTRNDSDRGRTPGGVPKIVAKMYSEYRLPFADGLILTGGAYYIGKRNYHTDRPTTAAPGEVIFDLGARYETKIQGRETVFRLNIENLTDRRYWQQVGSYSALGNPRTVTFTGSVRF